MMASVADEACNVMSQAAAEIERLRLVNAELLEACRAARATHTLMESEQGLPSISEVGRMLRSAIASAEAA